MTKYFLSEPTARKVQALINDNVEGGHIDGQDDGAARELEVPVYFRLTGEFQPCQDAPAVESILLHPECAEFSDVDGGLGSQGKELKIYDVDQAVRRYNVSVGNHPDTPLPQETIVQAIQENSKDEITPGQNDFGFWRLITVMGCECGSESSMPESSSGSGSGSGSGSESGSESTSHPPSGSGSESGSGSPPPPPSEGSESSKSTAIVPASWTGTGYAALYIAEMPDVRFDEVMTVKVAQEYTCVLVDPRYVEVCEQDTIAVVSVCCDEPVVCGAKYVDGVVELKFADPDPLIELTATIRLSAIRRGFKNIRFEPRTERQFEQNEAFINSAYEA